MSTVASEIDRQAMPSTTLSRRETLPIDLLLVSAVGAVILLGLVMVASSSITISAEQGAST